MSTARIDLKPAALCTITGFSTMTITSVAGRCLQSVSAVRRNCSPLLWAVKHRSQCHLTMAQATLIDCPCTSRTAKWHSRGQEQQASLLRTSRGLRVQATEAEVTEAVAVAGDWLEAQKLDIRVGRVVSAELHPDADSLYVEQVDVGEEAPRTIVSGLVKYVPVEEMQGRAVLVLCNLKARNMRGIKSDGMLLCASNESHELVEPLLPPGDAQPGERVAYGDDETAAQPEPESPNKVQKKKIWEGVQPHLKTNDQRQVVYKGTVMTIGAGAVMAPTLANANIS